ncbi:hypothetical protein DL96DRAFT_1620303 [Flagelloscypha sp. PMI_526]|nr:hypothetical protein DL96DRAFT_1620303 [Flagelloscypha sp. PMI_526]
MSDNEFQMVFSNDNLDAEDLIFAYQPGDMSNMAIARLALVSQAANLQRSLKLSNGQMSSIIQSIHFANKDYDEPPNEFVNTPITDAGHPGPFGYAHLEGPFISGHLYAVVPEPLTYNKALLPLGPKGVYVILRGVVVGITNSVSRANDAVTGVRDSYRQAAGSLVEAISLFNNALRNGEVKILEKRRL